MYAHEGECGSADNNTTRCILYDSTTETPLPLECFGDHEQAEVFMRDVQEHFDVADIRQVPMTGLQTYQGEWFRGEVHHGDQ
jgi:hypothetical protein